MAVITDIVVAERLLSLTTTAIEAVAAANKLSTLFAKVQAEGRKISQEEWDALDSDHDAARKAAEDGFETL